MNKENEIIRVENLSFTYRDDEEQIITDEARGVKNVSFSVSRGEYVAILGHNGSGKSTLAKLLNLILAPDAGRIFVSGREITAEDFTEDDVFDVRRKIGMVFQNPDNQLVATVVEEDVAFGPENLGLPREEIRRRVNSALDKVGMTAYAKHAPHKLSGGQKQRIAIAGIIAMKPDVIIFDESTAMLDPLGRRDVIGIMEQLNREEGITVINITHYMDEAIRANRVIIMNDGEIAVDGDAESIFRDVEGLHRMGLEAPQGSELIFELRKLGIDIKQCGHGEDEAIDALYNLLQGQKI